MKRGLADITNLWRVQWFDLGRRHWCKLYFPAATIVMRSYRLQIISPLWCSIWLQTLAPKGYYYLYLPAPENRGTKSGCTQSRILGINVTFVNPKVLKGDLITFHEGPREKISWCLTRSIALIRSLLKGETGSFV